MTELQILRERFSVCQVTDLRDVSLEHPYTFVGRTDEECSFVCPTDCVPGNTLRREDGWRAFRIAGTLDLSLIGILAPIAGLLARQKIGIFALSTYNTDYILVKEGNLERAVTALRSENYRVTVL